MSLGKHAHRVEDISVYKHALCLFLVLLGDERQGGTLVRIAEGRVGERRLGIGFRVGWRV